MKNNITSLQIVTSIITSSQSCFSWTFWCCGPVSGWHFPSCPTLMCEWHWGSSPALSWPALLVPLFEARGLLHRITEYFWFEGTSGGYPIQTPVKAWPPGAGDTGACPGGFGVSPEGETQCPPSQCSASSMQTSSSCEGQSSCGLVYIYSALSCPYLKQVLWRNCDFLGKGELWVGLHWAHLPCL